MSEGPDPLRLREAGVADAPRVAALSAQLGYPLEVEVVVERISRLRTPEHALCVAVRGKEGVLGWVEVRMEETLTSGRRGRVVGLVVDARARRSGVGRALLVWAEEWVAARHGSEAYLTSNVVRDEAHGFYERLGWTRKKTSHVYARPVDLRRTVPRQ